MVESIVAGMNRDSLTDTITSALHNGHCKELRPSRGLFQADVYLLDIEGQYVVVKDFSGRPWLSRLLVCRHLIKRETSVLARFGESGFVPQFYGRITDDVFAMEFLEGEHPGGKNRGQWPDAFSQAGAFLEMFHNEGYVHNDFRRTNVLIQPDGSVRFFDFASAIRKPRRCRWLLLPWCWLLNVMQRSDTASLLKMKPDFTGQPLSAAERRQLKKPKWVRGIQYFWSNCINKPILRRFK